MSSIQAKNSEIKKIAEDSRKNFDKLKEKEAELRRLVVELEQAKQQATSMKQTATQSQ